MTESPDTNSAFQALSQNILNRLLADNPSAARSLGLHDDYDGLLPDLSKGAIAERIAQDHADIAQLEAVPDSVLTRRERLDRDSLRTQIETELFYIESLGDWKTNPVFYEAYGDIAPNGYIDYDYAPLAERLSKLVTQERQVPDFLASIRANLREGSADKGMAQPLVEMALIIAKGQIMYREADLQTTLAGPDLSPALVAEVKAAAQASVAALNEYRAFLTEEQGRAHTEYAIGADMFSTMLHKTEALDLPLADVLAAGERNLEENLALFRETAAQLDPHSSPSEVFERLKNDHPTITNLVSETSATLEEIRAFLVNRDLITLPDLWPTVAPSPAFMRSSFAFCAGPSPFGSASEGYYYLTHPEDDWDEGKKQSWMTFFGYAPLEAVSIHEVYPGHFAHFARIRSFAPTRISRSTFSTAHVEGWAHYGEQMMLEEGYGRDKGEKHALEVRLGQLSAALMRNCRYVAAIKLHTQGMSVDEAARLFMEAGYMSEAPAYSEARRGTYQPSYLAYTLGKLMFLKLREDLKREQGRDFNLKTFHNDCTANGGPAIPYLRRFLLEQDNGKALPV